VIPNQNQFYKIVNKPHGVVTDFDAGDKQHNVVAWPWHGGNSQRWMFVPLNNNYYAMVSKFGVVADFDTGDPQHAVDAWPWHGGDSQQWFLHDLEGGYQKISNKLTGLVVDYDAGNPKHLVTAWPWHGGDSQRWLPEAVESFNLPSVPTYPVPAVPQYGNINDILPDFTEKVATQYTLAPFIAVDDPYYSDGQQQLKTNPYYLYIRKQYWKRVASHTLAPNETHKYIQTTGMTQEDQNIVSKTVGHTIGVDVGFQFGKEDKAHSSASLSYQYTTQLATHESHTTTQMTEETKELSIFNSNPYIVAWTKYVLVSEYSVQRSDGTLVREPWTVTDPNTTSSSYYPTSAKLLDS